MISALILSESELDWSRPYVRSSWTKSFEQHSFIFIWKSWPDWTQNAPNWIWYIRGSNEIFPGYKMKTKNDINQLMFWIYNRETLMSWAHCKLAVPAGDDIDPQSALYLPKSWHDNNERRKICRQKWKIECKFTFVKRIIHFNRMLIFQCNAHWNRYV